MNYTDNVHLVMGCTSAVSVVMCAIAVSMVIFLRLYKHFMYRLASYQVIGALLTNVATGLVFLQFARVSNTNNCRIVAFINVYFGWIELLLTLGMTAHVFSYVMCRKSLAHLEWFYVAASFLVPLLYSWVPFVTGNYGENVDNECFIIIDKGAYTGVIEMSTLYAGPFLLLMTLDMVFVVVMVFYVRYRSRKHRSSVMSSSLNNPYEEYRRGLAYMSPLLAYPIIFFVIILLLFALLLITVLRKTWFSFVAVAVISSSGWIAGLVLISHVCYAHVYQRGTMVPFETDRRLILVEDSEK